MVNNKKEEVLAISLIPGLVIGELLIWSLNKSLWTFSSYLVHKNHFAGFDSVFIWYGLAFLIGSLIASTLAGIWITLIKNDDIFEHLADDGSNFDNVPEWFTNGLKKLRLYNLYLTWTPMLVFIAPFILEVLLFKK